MFYTNAFLRELLSKKSGGHMKDIIELFNIEKLKEIYDIKNDNFYSQEGLNFINFLLELCSECSYYHYYNEDNNFSRLNFDDYETKDKNVILMLRENLDYYFLHWNNDSNTIVFSSDQNLIEIIKNNKLEELFNLFKSAKTLTEKESFLTKIVNKVIYLLDSKNKNFARILDEKLTKEKRMELCGRLHGYFRHSPNDINSPEAIKYEKFSEEEKNEAINEAFVDILYVLSFLRIKNNKSIEKLYNE